MQEQEQDGHAGSIAHERTAPRTPEGRTARSRQGVSEGESMHTESELDMDMDMQYDTAVCEEDGEEDAPRRSEEDANGSDSDQQNHAAPTDGTGAPFPRPAVPGESKQRV